MFDLMTQAKNAIDAYNKKLRATTLNVSNMSIVGYKRVEVNFEEVYNTLLKDATPASDVDGGKNPLQSGGSIGIASMDLDFRKGDAITSSSPYSLYANGGGLFIVSGDGGKTFEYTRAGEFDTDSTGYLSDLHGNRVYGFARRNGITFSSQLVPIYLGDIPKTIESVSPIDEQTHTYTLTFGDNGELQYYRIPDPLNSANPEYIEEPDSSFQIALSVFNNPSGLFVKDGTVFSETSSSGEPSSPQIPGRLVGTVKPRSVEGSNVFYVSETIDAMEIQRAITGALSMVKLLNDVISQFINRVS